MNRRLAWDVAALAAALLSSLTAQAQMVDLHGVGARARGMAGAVTGLADDGSAAFYNPALFATMQATSLMVEYGYLVNDFSYSLLPNDGFEGLVSYPGAAPSAPDAHGLGLSVVVPFTGVLERKLGLGFHAYIPLKQLVRQTVLYRSAPSSPLVEPVERVTLFAGGGFRPLGFISPEADILSIGVALHAALHYDVKGTIDLNMDYLLGDRDWPPEQQFDVTGRPSLAPIVSLLVEPLDWLRLSFVWRGRVRQEFSITEILKTGDLEILGLPVHAATDYYFTLDRDDINPPHRLTGSAVFDLGRVRLAIDGTACFWGEYNHPSGRWNIIELEFEDPVADGPTKRTEVSVVMPRIAPRTSADIRVGAEWIVSQMVTLRAGYGFVQGFLDRQEWFSNLLVPNFHVLGIGGDISIELPGQALEHPLLLRLWAQFVPIQPVTVSGSKPASMPDWMAGLRDTAPTEEERTWWDRQFEIIENPYREARMSGFIYGGGFSFGTSF